MTEITTEDLPARLRSLPGAARLLDAFEGEHEVWVVGGAVRDVLLGRRPSELDFVVEGDAADVARRAAKRLSGWAIVHARFGTTNVEAPALRFDLASARRERYPRPGALPEVALGASLAEDLARRDFTVNAIAVRLDDGDVVAHPAALQDLRDGVLRVLHDDSFLDDPTRLLRLARYSARLGFRAEEHTDALARAAIAAGAPATVSGPRLGAELRLLGREPQPTAVSELEARGLGAAVLHPAFAVEAGVVQRALELCPADGRGDLVALAAACLEVPPAELHARLDTLAFPASEHGPLAAAASHAKALAAALSGADRPSGVWMLLRREPVECVALAGALGPEGPARLWLQVQRHTRLEIGGNDLLAEGLEGPRIGRALDAAMAAALDGGAPGREEQLAAALAAG
jgi:tRNA nucleotidyltransferase (CCA-adding enzyme)